MSCSSNRRRQSGWALVAALAVALCVAGCGAQGTPNAVSAATERQQAEKAAEAIAGTQNASAAVAEPSEGELRASLTEYLREAAKRDNPYHPSDNTVQNIHLVKDGDIWWGSAEVVPVESTMEQMTYIAKRVGGKWKTVGAGSDPYPNDGTYVPKPLLRKMGYE